MEITKRLTLEQLPPVLILHLKCFVYDKDGGSQKLIKDVNFTIDLEITKGMYIIFHSNEWSLLIWG